jgi:alanyl-tRNA synthetase
MARLAGVPADSLVGHFRTTRERLAEVEKERSRLKLESARKEGRARWESAEPDGGGNRKILAEMPALDEGARFFAQGFVENGHAALLLVSRNPPSVLLAVTKDFGCDAGVTLKSALQKFSGRGGGSSTMAQGTVPREPDLMALAEELGFEA